MSDRLRLLDDPHQLVERLARTAPWLAAMLVVLLVTGYEREQASAAANATYVGGETCAACHQREAELWKGSDHDLAMQSADRTTVLGNFNNATFRKDGVTSTFFTRDGRLFVHTDGPDGQLHEYRIAYTFGIYPLQQYLIEFPDGRYQALSIVWDTRPAAAGGQRWFHLHPKEKIDHRDILAALASFNAERGERAEAQRYADHLRTLSATEYGS